MAESFFDKIYGITDPGDMRAHYDRFADQYDEAVRGSGYATPARCAAALASHLTPYTAPILDFGCGTGLSGLALTALGFTTIDGMDVSEGMLEQARARGLYRNLTHISSDDPLPIEPGTYAGIAAIGVISTGAAPAETLDALLATLAPGGMIVFSFNDHALEDPSFEGRVHANLAAGTARQVFRDYGDHLPGKNLKSVVYVLEKI